MQKPILSFLFLLSFATIRAEETSMIFRTIDGNEQSISTNALTISFKDGMLLATSASSTISVPLSNMKSMAFSDYYASIGNLTEDNNETEIEIYNVDGTLAGKAKSAKEACISLPEGIYILKSSDNKTQKISVTK